MQITVAVDPSALGPGEYAGTITITPVNAGFLPVTVALTFRTARSIISVTPLALSFATDSAGTPPAPLTLTVTGAGEPTAFSAILNTSQADGNWLSVTPPNATTPATLTVSADPSARLRGAASVSGTINITAPSNAVSIAASLATNPPPALHGNPPSLTFWAKMGSPPPAPQSVSIYPYAPDTITVATDNGGSWLAASLTGPAVSVNATGLGPGIYRGAVTFSSAAHGELAPAQIPVVLVVWNDPPPVSATPASLVLSAPTGSEGYGKVSVTDAGIPVDCTVSTSTEDHGILLTVSKEGVPGCTLDVSADAAGLVPGPYHGTLTITAPPGAASPLTVLVTLNVTPPLPQPGPPLAVSILNAASVSTGAIAPGEILTILGLNVGPSSPAGLSIGADGRVSTNLGGARVLFDGVAAPLLYASPTQANLVVPYELEGKAATTVEVELAGTRVTAAGIPVAQSAPALFTADATGQGQVYALNQDNSRNSPGDAAARGSVIRIFATGEGQTTPAGVTGEITQNPKRPLLPVSVKIGGTDATVTDAGSAPGQVAGLFQVDVLVPPNVPPGAAVPVVLTVGSAHSQDSTTVAVK